MKKKTRYRGYYIDIRNGFRVGVTFTYEMKYGYHTMCNEKEISVVKL